MRFGYHIEGLAQAITDLLGGAHVKLIIGDNGNVGVKCEDAIVYADLARASAKGRKLANMAHLIALKLEQEIKRNRGEEEIRNEEPEAEGGADRTGVQRPL